LSVASRASGFAAPDFDLDKLAPSQLLTEEEVADVLKCSIASLGNQGRQQARQAKENQDGVSTLKKKPDHPCDGGTCSVRGARAPRLSRGRFGSAPYARRRQEAGQGEGPIMSDERFWNTNLFPCAMWNCPYFSPSFLS
jgi:hypothetical protein